MRLLPVGDRALLVELDDGAEAAALHAELLRRRADGALPPVREIVPAARTVLIDGIGASDGAARVGGDARDRLAAELPRWTIAPLAPGSGAVVEIPVRYDGPDLAEVAAAWGVGVREVAGIHSGTEFHVAFCGFAPGFGYLTGLGDRFAVPRRTTPRTSVPAGSVALAGTYTGVYPRSSPGGWRIVGTTGLTLWDPEREPAALLSPGARVRFVPVSGGAAG
ncbi:allophanate hydrolase subunit 1 [Streptomyces sp. SCSIO 30461]|uniref:5-oxoprolinase subunit B family protein n=1 Tax=Streptomyces sp. SCSIO 30461 TaxID=3118085 RepID=UPI0030CBCE00